VTEKTHDCASPIDDDAAAARHGQGVFCRTEPKRSPVPRARLQGQAPVNPRGWTPTRHRSACHAGGFHAIRHAHLSEVANAVSPTVAHQQAGHSDLATTSHYLHEERTGRKAAFVRVVVRCET
jgi:integrase